MFFPANLIIALILAIINVALAFKFRLPQKYKNIYRIYSILIHASFILFLIFFSFFLYSAGDNTGLQLFSIGLDIFYILTTLPLLSLLFYYTSKWLINLEDYSKLVRFILFFIAFTVFVVSLYFGYVLFILMFYGFAP